MGFDALLGSALVDLSEVDFSATSPQTIDGLYEKVDIAFNSGKPIIAVGDWSSLIGAEKCTTAYYTYITYNDEVYIVWLPNGYTLGVDSDNGVILSD